MSLSNFVIKYFNLIKYLKIIINILFNIKFYFIYIYFFMKYKN